MFTQFTMSSSKLAVLSLTIGALTPVAAQAQAQLSGTPSSFFGFGGVNMLAGNNATVTGSAGIGTLTSTFVGDTIVSLSGNASPGTYTGFVGRGSVVPFTVGALPVRIGDASLHANFKIVATGGNGIEDGNDPVVTASILVRLYQQLGASPVANTDPWLSAIEFSRSYTQNGNGLQVIDDSFGPATSNYVLTPGNYYLFQQILITTAYTSNGVIQPQRGATMEFGGDLSSGYSGLQYTFSWQTVPTPGSAALLGLGGLVAMRRRR